MIIIVYFCINSSVWKRFTIDNLIDLLCRDPCECRPFRHHFATHCPSSPAFVAFGETLKIASVQCDLDSAALVAHLWFCLPVLSLFSHRKPFETPDDASNCRWVLNYARNSCEMLRKIPALQAIYHVLSYANRSMLTPAHLPHSGPQHLGLSKIDRRKRLLCLHKI